METLGHILISLFIAFIIIECIDFLYSEFCKTVPNSRLKNKIYPNRYKLNVSYIQFCREVVLWTGPIMRENKIKYFPTISMKYTKATRTMGTYGNNHVTIFLNSHNRKNNTELIETLASSTLHECFHHIQSKIDPEYKALTNYKKFGYYNNRIEIECRAFEAKFYKQCLKDLTKKGIVSIK